MEISSHSRVKIVKIVKDPETGERMERLDESPNTKPEDTQNLAFVLRKTVHDKFSDEDDSSEIDIINPDLWELLKEHLGGYPYHMFRASPVTLDSPYEEFIFEWDVLKSAATQDPKDEEDKQAREDLQILLDTISGGSSGDARLDKYFKTREVCKSEKTVQFDDLWTIFPPGTLVYGKPFQSQDQVFLVRDYKSSWPEPGDRPQQMLPWTLVCWTYDWNGEAFQRTSYELLFDQFDGHKPITSLPFYPFELHPDHDSIKRTLIKSGKMFRKLCTATEGSRLFEYDGETIFGKKGFTGLVQTDEVGRGNHRFCRGILIRLQDDLDMRSTNYRLDYERRLLRRHRSTLGTSASGGMNSSFVSHVLSHPRNSSRC